MEDDNDAINWVLVDETDCSEQLLPVNSSVTLLTDSDKESDGSISIISYHPTDSSEEEHEEPEKVEQQELVPTVDTASQILQEGSEEPTRLTLVGILKPVMTVDTASQIFEENIEELRKLIHVGEPKIETVFLENDNNIVSEQLTYSYSEGQHKHVAEPEHVSEIDPASQVSVQKEDGYVQVRKVESSESSEEVLAQDVSKSVTEDSSINFQNSDCDISSTSESSKSKEWAYIEDKSKLELNIIQKPFFLDCSKEPILEVSPNETEFDSESTTSNLEESTLIRKQGSIVSTATTNRESTYAAFNRLGIGIVISLMVLVGSHLIQQYSEYQDDKVHNLNQGFLEGLADNDKTKAIIGFCMEKQKTKEDYSEHTVQKCVIRRLRKKNREEEIKKTEIYLQMKERILELREKELAEKEKEILRKWRKRNFAVENTEKPRKKRDYYIKPKEPAEGHSKFHKKWGFKNKKKPDSKEEIVQKDEEEQPWFHKKYFWNSQEVIPTSHGKAIREPTYRKHKMVQPENAFPDKKTFKKSNKNKEEKLRNLKERVKKSYQKIKPKRCKGELKSTPKEDPNEEWYIKFNPLKNTLELINITTLPKQDSSLIKNGNKTINGQWYFSLHGARSRIRHKERMADWYFRRGHFRENKRDKAKWYFDYMSARDDTRYFY